MLVCKWCLFVCGRKTKGSGFVQMQLEGMRMCGALAVRYYLLLGSTAGQTSYGIAVEAGGEGEAVLDLTVSRSRAEALMRRLIAGSVTAVTVRDVVDDWLLE